MENYRVMQCKECCECNMIQRHAQQCHYGTKACETHCFQDWSVAWCVTKKAAVMRQNLCINLRALTVESVRNSSLRLSSLGQPTHGGTAASDTFPCFSLMKASCSLLNSPSRLCEQNSIITCHSWKKHLFFRDLKRVGCKNVYTDFSISFFDHMHAQGMFKIWGFWVCNVRVKQHFMFW